MASRNRGAHDGSAPLEPRAESQEWIAPDDEPELPQRRRRTRGSSGVAQGAIETFASSKKRGPKPAAPARPAPVETAAAGSTSQTTPAPRPPVATAKAKAQAKPKAKAAKASPAQALVPKIPIPAEARVRAKAPVAAEGPAPADFPAKPPPKAPATRRPPALVTPERIAADAVSAAEEFPSLLARRSDPVWSVVGPPTGAVAARPVPTGGAEVAPARGDRSRRWLPLGVILAASVAIVALLFLVGQVLPSAIKSSSQLPGSPEAPTGAVIAVIVVAAAAIVAARRRILDSRVIGTGLAIVLLLIAAQLLKTPGASADIREIPGQVNGLIQQTVAQPEPGYPRIRIKRVGIDLLMVKGDGRTPPVKYEAFTYPRADHVLAQQGTAGNTYVYAHARTGMFWNLHDVNIGDTIEIDYGGGKISRYRISEIHKSVSWKDFEWLQPTSDNRLTLQTCNGWRDEDPRLIVVAHPVPDTSTALAH